MLAGAARDQLQGWLEGAAMVCGRAAVVPRVSALSRAPGAVGIPAGRGPAGRLCGEAGGL